MLHEGSIYLTTSEFYGKGTHRVPSIYWAIIEPGSLATGAVTVHGSGVIASKDGLMLGFPVIAALSSGDGAIIAYSYAKAGDVNGIGAAYPGECLAPVRQVCRKHVDKADFCRALGHMRSSAPRLCTQASLARSF